MTLARLTARKLTPEEVQGLVENVLTDLSGVAGLTAIVLFGSAATSEMSEASDLDIVMVFDTEEHCNLARREVHSLRRTALWPMDILCVDLATYRSKSEIGGVYFVAAHEGRIIYGTRP